MTSVSYRPGARWFGAACETEIIVIRAPAEPIGLTFGGLPPVSSAADRAAGARLGEGHDGGAQMGKRYVGLDGGLEVLCTKAGAGVPGLDGTPLDLKGVVALPASD